MSIKLQMPGGRGAGEPPPSRGRRALPSFCATFRRGRISFSSHNRAGKSCCPPGRRLPAPSSGPRGSPGGRAEPRRRVGPLGGALSARQDGGIPGDSSKTLASASRCDREQIPLLAAQVWLSSRALKGVAAGVLCLGVWREQDLAESLPFPGPWRCLQSSMGMACPARQPSSPDTALLLLQARERMEAQVRETASDPPGEKRPVGFQAG